MKKCLLILGGGEERDHCIERCDSIGITPEFCAVDPEAPGMDTIAQTARRVHAAGVFPADRAAAPFALAAARTLKFPAPPATGDASLWAAFHKTTMDYSLPTVLADNTSNNALERAAGEIGLPCWVRAVGARNGAHCFTVDSTADLPLRAEQAADQSACDLAAVQAAGAGPVRRALGFKIGREYVPVALLEETFQDGPYRVTRELRVESGVAAARDVPVLEVARRTADAMPKGHGLIETEIVVTENGPKLAGVCNRVVVEPAVDALLRATLGICLLDDALRLAAGERPHASPSQGLAGALRWFAPPSGMVNGVTGVEMARALPGVAEVAVTAREGVKLGHTTGEASRDAGGYVVAVATHAEAAAARAKDACEAVAFDTERVTA